MTANFLRLLRLIALSVTCQPLILPAADFPVALRDAEPRLLGAKRGWFESLRLSPGATHAVRCTVGKAMSVFISTSATGGLQWSLQQPGGAATALSALPPGKSFPVAGANATDAGEWTFLLGNNGTAEQFCSIEITAGAAMANGAGTSRITAQDLMPSLSQPLRLRRLGATGRLAAGVSHWWKFSLAAESRISLHLSGTGAFTRVLTNAAGEVPFDDDILPAGGYWIQISGPAETYGLGVVLDAARFPSAGGPALPGYAPPGVEEPQITAFIADYGDNSINEANVARMIRHWNPHFIMAGGDNTYVQAAETVVGAPAWSRNIGAYYGEFILRRADNKYPDQFSPVQRFFPAVGNHDTSITEGGGGSIAGYLDYFHHNPGGPPRFEVDPELRPREG